MAPGNIRDKVFISYSHKDREWLEYIQSMLSPEIPTDEPLLWDDTKIEPGDLWRAEISRALDQAKVAILLVSRSFLASGFIKKHELPPILDAAAKEGLKILWVTIDECMYENREIVRYQAVGDPSKPLKGLPIPEQDKIIKKLCQ